MPRKVILDCDPGHDDAMAILLAHGNPDVDLVAITTVAGNHTIDKVTLNARRVCSVAGIDNVPIAQGGGHPLVRELVVAPEVHGDSGLDGPEWDEPTVGLVDEHAVDLIIRLVMASPGEITLVPVGPLTNIALALRKEPQIAANVREVVLMGGSSLRGNKTPAGESNIYVDPEAAAAVFGAPWQVTMVGLNLTYQALATREVLARISELGTRVATVAVELMEFFRARYLARSGFEAPPVHDACCIARVIDPAVVDCVETFVAIETASDLTRGMTLVDLDNRFEREPNALVATKLDFDGFWDLMVDAIRRIG
jgi:inosine-uridine nucleoside N-ribohydrolase